MEYNHYFMLENGQVYFRTLYSCFCDSAFV